MRGPQKLAACGVTVLAAAIVAAALHSGARAAFPGPNGRIAFVSTRGGGIGDVYTMNPDGSDVVELTKTHDFDIRSTDPAWTADGRQIVYRTAGVVRIMNADGSGSRAVTGMLGGRYFHPTPSPDGRKIVFSSDRTTNFELYVVNVDGSGLQQLTSSSLQENDPAWSADGARIAFTGRGASGGIYTMPAAGGPATQLTSDGGVDPDWSPDGRRIVFVSAAASRDELNPDVFVMNADGSGVQRLRPGTEPSWSPDGSRIAFTNGRNVFSMAADGGDLRQLTSTATNFGASWGRTTLPGPPPGPTGDSGQTGCVVPNVRRLPFIRARTLLERAGCRSGKVTRVYSAKVPYFYVVAQAQRPRTKLPRGTRVNLTISRGPRP